MAQQLNFAAKAMMSGLVGYWLWLWGLLKAHEHGMANSWLVLLLPFVLGLLIGRYHRWAFLVVAAGPLISLFHDWRLVDSILVFGVPMILGGALEIGLQHAQRHTAA